MKIENRIPDIIFPVRLNSQTGNISSQQISASHGMYADSVDEAVVSAPEVPDVRFSLPDSVDVETAAERLNKMAEARKKVVSYSIDKDTNTTVIKVFNSQTGEMVRQFPQEDVLAMKARINSITGRFIHITA
ncbi:flagellar protein FlaG [bacterium]|nr:flagellar protein FlaG [bacterium]